jgi:TM2 domain-containing membrane protein YozV
LPFPVSTLICLLLLRPLYVLASWVFFLISLGFHRTLAASAAMGRSVWAVPLASLLAFGLVLGSVEASLGDVDPRYR